MKLSLEERRRIELEYKATEAFRVQSVLASLGALPAAALVFGDAAAAVAPGAPLYCAAITLLIGAYLHWMYLDQAFYLSVGRTLAEGQDAENKWLMDLFRSAQRNQTMTYLYGFGSMVCTFAGVAAVYGDVHAPISIEIGFAGVLVLGLAVFCDVFASNIRRNQLVDRTPA